MNYPDENNSSMAIPALVFFILMILLLSGCGPTVAQVRAKINEAKQTVSTLSAAADQLQQVAEASKDPEVIKAVAAARAAVDAAQAKIPELEKELAGLKDSDPWWTAAIAGLGAIGTIVGPRVIGLIPYVGPIIQALMANGAWRVTATKEQKLEDKANPISGA